MDILRRNTAYSSVYGPFLQIIVVWGGARTRQDDCQRNGKYKTDPEMTTIGHWRDYSDRRGGQAGKGGGKRKNKRAAVRCPLSTVHWAD